MELQLNELKKDSKKWTYECDTIFGRWTLFVEKIEDKIIVTLTSSFVEKQFEFKKEHLKMNIKEFLKWIG